MVEKEQQNPKWTKKKEKAQKVLLANYTLLMEIGIFLPLLLIIREIKV